MVSPPVWFLYAYTHAYTIFVNQASQSMTLPVFTSTNLYVYEPRRAVNFTNNGS